MNLYNYQTRLERAAAVAATTSELQNEVYCIVDDILDTDAHLWGIGREFAGYGTWRMRLWVNEYGFGRDLAKELNNHYIVTHDEDREYTLYDFQEIITDVCWQFALDRF